MEFVDVDGGGDFLHTAAIQVQDLNDNFRLVVVHRGLTIQEFKTGCLLWYEGRDSIETSLVKFDIIIRRCKTKTKTLPISFYNDDEKICFCLGIYTKPLSFSFQPCLTVRMTLS